MQEATNTLKDVLNLVRFLQVKYINYPQDKVAVKRRTITN
jgi:hypothetical protein